MQRAYLPNVVLTWKIVSVDIILSIETEISTNVFHGHALKSLFTFVRSSNSSTVSDLVPRPRPAVSSLYFFRTVDDKFCSSVSSTLLFEFCPHNCSGNVSGKWIQKGNARPGSLIFEEMTNRFGRLVEATALSILSFIHST